MQRRGPEEWRRLVTEWRESGSSVVEFARRVGVHPKTMYRWKQIIEGAPRKVREPRLAKIVEVRPARAGSDDRFEVRLAGCRSIVVPTSFDDMALRRLLGVLEASA